MADKDDDKTALIQTVGFGIQRRRGVFILGWTAFVIAGFTALVTQSNPNEIAAFIVIGGFVTAFICLMILVTSGSAVATEQTHTLMKELSLACDARDRVAIESLLQQARNLRLSAQEFLPLQRAEAIYAALIEQEAKAAASRPTPPPSPT